MDFECQFVCELKELAPVPALLIRTHTTMSELGSLFETGYHEILQLLAGQGKSPLGPPFARYYGMSTGSFEIEFGFPVEGEVEGKGRVVAGSTPSGKAASSLYIGPYGEIEGVYDALMKWVDDNGFELSGEAYEIYLDNPAETPPDQLRTRVYLMLHEG
ncbi:GyrI-like domain-containing protein [Chlorobaculum sp. MV4-Y]|jgi:effector-binding domain-containing protein|uniref:GyrI-like domain-containing protein n=1 Tax=Chlorobaculum sp. MV4-Y TaxID=2976335 RepID=UPI0021AFF11F|nr:GyrI-like domain-containing protein [Chlorobaculum sp. MV4-Y]UWX57813.1 GyrI-like domain-containing protein [Chlorobaculum sp. MV4-Y]